MGDMGDTQRESGGHGTPGHPGGIRERLTTVAVCVVGVVAVVCGALILDGRPDEHMPPGGERRPTVHTPAFWPAHVPAEADAYGMPVR